MASLAWWEVEAARARRALDSAGARQLREMRKLLKGAGEEVLQRMAAARPGTYTYQYLEALADEIKGVTATLEAKLGQLVPGQVEEAAALGQESADRVTSKFQPRSGRILLRPALDHQQLLLWSNFRLDLVRNGITEPVKRAMVSQLKLGYAAGRTPFESMTKLAGMSFDKLSFASKFHRAEAIVRTENGRVAAQANQARGEQYNALSAANAAARGENAPLWHKRWITAEDERVRPSHAAVGDLKPIALDAKYQVGGHEAMYPRDPALPPEESVNCRCTSINIPPGMTDFDEVKAKRKAKAEKAKAPKKPRRSWEGQF